MVAGNTKKRNIKAFMIDGAFHIWWCDRFYTETCVVFLKVRRQVLVGIVCGNKVLLEIGGDFNKSFAKKEEYFKWSQSN